MSKITNVALFFLFYLLALFSIAGAIGTQEGISGFLVTLAVGFGALAFGLLIRLSGS